MRKLLLYGAGGHASVIADVAHSQGRYIIAGLIDDDPLIVGRERFGYRVRGAVHEINRHDAELLFLAIGDNHARHRAHLKTRHWDFPTLIHPTAVIGREVSIGAGTVVMPGAVIEHGAIVGEHCIVNNGAVIGHGAHVSDYCHVSGNSVVGGEVRLGRFVFVGMGAVVTPRIRVGKNCLITAGSVSEKNVDEGATVIGNPGRPLFNRRDLS